MFFFFSPGKGTLRIVRTKSTGVELYVAKEMWAPISYLSEQQIQSHIPRILTLPGGVLLLIVFLLNPSLFAYFPLIAFISLNQF